MTGDINDINDINSKIAKSYKVALNRCPSLTLPSPQGEKCPLGVHGTLFGEVLSVSSLVPSAARCGASSLAGPRSHMPLAVDKHATSMGAIFGMASDSSEAACLSSEPTAPVGSKRSAQPIIKGFTVSRLLAFVWRNTFWDDLAH